jgi:hypothetical protein
MQVYDCHVRVGRTTTSEVPKPSVTAPEIIILRDLHGADAVVRLSAPRMDARPHAQERARLQRIYGDSHPGLLTRLFGPDHVPLPVTLSVEGEASAAEAVAAAEAAETERKAAEKALFDEAVRREVARLEGVRLAKEAEARNNSDTPQKPSGTLRLKA